MLTFDPKAHRYAVNGRHVPSVTQVIGILQRFDHVRPAVLERARLLGQLVHEAVHFDNENDLNECDQTIEPYVHAWRDCRDAIGIRIRAVENRMYSRVWGFDVAGQLDVAGDMVVDGTSRVAVIDIKTGSPQLLPVRMQTAAYACAYAENNNLDYEQIRRYYCLLRPTGRYKLVPLRGADDLSLFLSLLNIYQAIQNDHHNKDD